MLDKAQATVASLPHGDQRKLEVALLMALDPAVYMFDEPTAGMSHDEAPVILNLIRALKKDKTKTILLVEHKMDVVRELADRINRAAKSSAIRLYSQFDAADHEQWGKVLDRWRETERWSASWGPDPDQSTCKVPADMLAAHNLKYRRSLFRQADLDRFEALASKQPVDTTHGAVL